MWAPHLPHLICHDDASGSSRCMRPPGHKPRRTHLRRRRSPPGTRCPYSQQAARAQHVVGPCSLDWTHLCCPRAHKVWLGYCCCWQCGVSRVACGRLRVLSGIVCRLRVLRAPPAGSGQRGRCTAPPQPQRALPTSCARSHQQHSLRHHQGGARRHARGVDTPVSAQPDDGEPKSNAARPPPPCPWCITGAQLIGPL